jgi:hypothetical protein
MKLSKSLVIAAIALMCASAGTVLAQNDAGNGGQGGNRRGGPGGPGGGGDPAQWMQQMQQRRLDTLKEQMAVTDDAEWKVIQESAEKVMTAQREAMSGRGMGMGGRRGGNNDQGGGQQRRGGFGTPSPELEALQTAIDNNAPAAQVKAALEKYRAARKAKEAALEKAQADLKKILTAKQEAVAVVNGLLN